MSNTFKAYSLNRTHVPANKYREQTNNHKFHRHHSLNQTSLTNLNMSIHRGRRFGGFLHDPQKLLRRRKKNPHRKQTSFITPVLILYAHWWSCEWFFARLLAMVLFLLSLTLRGDRDASTIKESAEETATKTVTTRVAVWPDSVEQLHPELGEGTKTKPPASLTLQVDSRWCSSPQRWWCCKSRRTNDDAGVGAKRVATGSRWEMWPL